MKKLYKPMFNRFLLPVVLSGITLCANAQSNPQLQSKERTGNFTYFTPDRTYSDIAKLTSLTPPQFRNNPDFGKRMNDSAQWYEQIDKRTLKTRQFIGNDNEIITQNAYDNINYVDGNGWMRAADTKLKPYLNGWAARQQEMPVYLYPDASTAITIGNNELMVFNKNVKFDYKDIGVSNYTVGDNGMYIKNAASNTDKIIHFGRGAVETDYRIEKPLNLNGDLVISEDIVLPAGYIISANTDHKIDNNDNVALVVLSADGQIAAELKAPLCFDDHRKSSISGSYNVQKQSGGYRLEIQVPSSWLNDPTRNYPVTIDPLVYGTRVSWTGGKIPSCLAPNYGSGAITVTVPAGISITHCYVQGSWWCPIISKKYITETFSTKCSEFGPVSVPDTTTLPGLAFGKFDTYSPLYYQPIACCIKPSCVAQTLSVTLEVTRDSGGTDCDSTQYGWYDPLYATLYDYLGDTGTFEAYIIGRTIQDSTWSISPTAICANECSIDLNTLVYFGVPPFKVKDAWSTDSVSFGTQLGCAASRGTATLALNIPNCPRRPCLDTTLSVPPPIITDACKNVAANIKPLILTLNPVPNVMVAPDTETICSGTNVDLALSSCLSGGSYSWMSSQGASGGGDTIDNAPNNSSSNSIKVNYTVTPTAGGCTGGPTTFPITITPFTITINPATPAICEGSSISLTASGDATNYTWSPNSGLSCTSCNNPTANPTVTTTYIVLGTGNGNCSAYDTVIVVVNPNPTLDISKDTTIFAGHSVQLSANTSDSVTWTPSTGLSCTDCSSPIATPQNTTTYKATATLGDCVVSEDVIITVVQPCNSLSVPTGFTPNGDGVNDYLHVLNAGDVLLQEFRVFNRWGEQVYETNNINDRGWDGTYNGKAEPVGTYVYYAKVSCAGNTVTIKGDVTLLR